MAFYPPPSLSLLLCPSKSREKVITCKTKTASTSQASSTSRLLIRVAFGDIGVVKIRRIDNTSFLAFEDSPVETAFGSVNSDIYIAFLTVVRKAHYTKTFPMHDLF